MADALLIAATVLIVGAAIGRIESFILRSWGAGEQAAQADSLTLRFLALGVLCLALGFFLSPGAVA